MILAETYSPDALLVILVVWLSCAVLAAVVADRKGYNSTVFFFVGLLLGCIGLALVLLMPGGAATSPVTDGSLVRFVRDYPLDGGARCTKGFAAKVQGVDVKLGTPAALIEGPDGARYWVPTSVLRVA
jgi:hypothetical protein